MKKYFAPFLLLVLFPLITPAQQKDSTIDFMEDIEIIDNGEVDDEAEVFSIVENMPEFPGGQQELFNFLGKNIKYPPKAKADNISGKVFINFVVDKDGSITDAKVIRGVHPLLDAEAMRVIGLMPKWKPGTQRGVNVRVSYNLPINFILRDTKNSPPPIEMPKSPEALENFKAAVELHLKEKYESAIQFYTMVLQKEPKHAVSYYARGDCYQKLNDLKSACDDWHKAKKMGFKDADEAIEKYCK